MWPDYSWSPIYGSTHPIQGNNQSPIQAPDVIRINNGQTGYHCQNAGDKNQRFILQEAFGYGIKAPWRKNHWDCQCNKDRTQEFRNPYRDHKSPLLFNAYHKRRSCIRRRNISVVKPSYFTGSCSYFGKLWGSSYHGARSAKNILWTGLISGSSSRVPAGMMTAFLLFVSHGKDEPQFLQNEVAKCFASGNSNRSTNSAPFIHWNWSGLTIIFEACAEPVNFWHLVQWQYWNTLASPEYS